MSIVTYFVSRRKHGSTAQCLTIRKTACACLMLGLLSSAHVMAADGNTVSSAASTVYATNVVQQSTRTVKGTVTDSNGDPLVGVTVTEKGTKNTVITDIDGVFTISVHAKAQLELSYIGFVATTVQAKPNMAIKLVEDGKELNEVVVVGYGTQKKANLTGAVTSVDVNKKQGGRIKMRSPPKVLTSNFRPSQLSFFLS